MENSIKKFTPYDENFKDFIDKLRADSGVDLNQIALYLKEWCNKPVSAKTSTYIYAFMSFIRFRSKLNWKELTKEEWSSIHVSQEAIIYMIASEQKYRENLERNSRTQSAKLYQEKRDQTDGFKTALSLMDEEKEKEKEKEK